MISIRRSVAAVVVAGSMVGGGAAGAAIYGATVGSSAIVAAPVAASSPAASAQPANPGSGTFKPNEDPAHEQGESAAREAQENAGQRPTVP